MKSDISDLEFGLFLQYPLDDRESALSHCLLTTFSSSEGHAMRYFYLISLAALPLCLPGCTDVPGQTKLKRGVTFEVHTVAAQAGPNTEPMTDPHTGDVLNLVKPPIITSNNVDTATVTIDQNAQVLFEVNVDGPGAARLSAATAGPRTQVAIVVNGKIVSAPVAHTPISSSFRVSGAYTRADWEKLVE